MTRNLCKSSVNDLLVYAYLLNLGDPTLEVSLATESIYRAVGSLERKQMLQRSHTGKAGAESVCETIWLCNKYHENGQKREIGHL